MAITQYIGVIPSALNRCGKQVRIDIASVLFPQHGADVRIAFSDIRNVSVQKNWLRYTLNVQTANREFEIQFLGRKTAERIQRLLQLFQGASRLVSIRDGWRKPEGKDQYLTHRLHQLWLTEARPYLQSIAVEPEYAKSDDPVLRAARDLSEVVRLGEAARTSRNEAYMRNQMSKHAPMFAAQHGYALNEEQVQAILHDEDRCLVVAGAGTGKTSTIVGKAVHVIAEQLAAPSEVLMLAFTRKASEEMAERMRSVAGVEVPVKTFHALGLEIAAHASGKKPSLSKLAEDDRAFEEAIQSFIQELLGSSSDQQKVTKFLAYERYPFRPLESFPSQHHLHQFVRSHEVRSLKGELLKSVEESIIANWLTLNGIKYEYEQPYKHDTATATYRQYRPDFYLPDADVYIEHFGIRKDGTPAPIYRDGADYLRSMEWKRTLHKKTGTKLLETYSYQVADRSIFQHLERSLRSLGLEPAPLSPEEAAAVVNDPKIIKPFTKLMTSFLNLYKGNAWTKEDVEARGVAANSQRVSDFIAIFHRVLEKYESALANEGAIDFSDMINLAARAVRDHRYASSYKYILVDEFQDISRGRALLINALLQQVPGAKMFCVGDDWQSIYRFTGSDIDLMVEFPKHFGFTRRTDLCQTHRFGEQLLAASSLFILENKQQLRKELRAAVATTLPAIEVVSRKETDDSNDGLIRVFDSVARESQENKISVLVLGRYHFVLDKYRELPVPDPRISVRFMTVHQAKGLEADFTILVDVVGGKYGFPTEIVDDPLLELVLAQQNAHPNAEERRLFYVALTRSRVKTYILTHDIQRSIFIDELETPKYRGMVIPSGAKERTVSCPTCGGGRLTAREGEWGKFWSCANYPQCKTKAKRCPRCGVGSFAKKTNEFKCLDSECSHTAEACPRCQVGALVERRSKYGPFLACSEWRSQGPSCEYTRDLRRR